MAVRDPRTEWLRVKIYRSMTPQHRMRLALDLMDMAQRSALANIKLRHPRIADAELKREMRRRMLPRDLFDRLESYLAEQQRT